MMGTASSKINKEKQILESSEEKDILDTPDVGLGFRGNKVKESSEEKEILDDPDVRFGFTREKANKLGFDGSNYLDWENENFELLFDGRLHNSEWVYKAAGWPSWLAEVAVEAIRGWLPRGISGFEKVEEIGQGTYSNVYKAYDIRNRRTVVLKKMKFDNVEPESVKIMAREILILRSLDHPNIIKLEGLVISDSPCSLYLVFEYMEHDLQGIASLPGVKFTDSQVKCYMHQLLTGLEYCHHRGVLHRDIKCSNLLLDNHGKLKIADFGLSTFFDKQQKFVLTSRVGTLWYRPPELLLGQIHYGVEVDLWSAGCVLGELYAGKPIMPGRTEVEQLHKIFKLCGSPSDDHWKKSKLPNATIFKPGVPYRRCLPETFKDVSATALGLLETLLSIEPECRGTATSALQNETKTNLLSSFILQFFTTEPLACNPSNLPKYPPSKEAYARLWERKPISPRTLVAPRADHGKRESKNQQAHEAPNANARSAGLMQNNAQMLKKTAQGTILEKAREIKDQVSVNHTKADPVYNNAQLLEKHDHNIKEVDEDNKEALQDSMEAAPMYPGPEVLPSYEVDQLLEEHDLQIQEFAQRLRHEKRRASKIQLQENQVEDHSLPSIPLSVSVFNVDDLLEEHDRQIQEATQRLMLEKKKACKVKL